MATEKKKRNTAKQNLPMLRHNIAIDFNDQEITHQAQATATNASTIYSHFSIEYFLDYFSQMLFVLCFYVSKRQAILSLGSLFDSFCIERNISLANTSTVLTIVKLNETSQLPGKRSCSEYVLPHVQENIFKISQRRVMCPNVQKEKIRVWRSNSV